MALRATESVTLLTPRCVLSEQLQSAEDTNRSEYDKSTLTTDRDNASGGEEIALPEQPNKQIKHRSLKREEEKARNIRLSL
jgi:hypothetical protein